MSMSSMKSVASSIKKSKEGLQADSKPLDLKVEAADRSSKEGYVSLDEIVGYKTGINQHFKKYKPEDFEEQVRDLIPTSNPSIILDAEYARAVCMAIEGNSTLLAYGPPGTGKSVTPREVCARLGYPFVYIQGMGGTEPADYVGSPFLEKVDGATQMVWKDGIASFAVRHGAFLLFDEPFKVAAQTNMCFQSLLDDRKQLKLHGHPDPINATLQAHPNFRIILADNVRGVGDGMANYAAEIQDKSTMDRMDMVVNVDYPVAKREVEILAKEYPNVSKDIITKVVKVGNLIRKAWSQDDVSLPFTLRKSSNWLKHLEETGDIRFAFKLTYLNGCTTDEEIQAVKKAYNMVKFGAGQEI